jgi:hypothetical protein
MGRILLWLLAFLVSSGASGQSHAGPVARFSFNNGNANDEIAGHHAKAYNTLPAEDRFGNRNHAMFLQGNYDSYINLGSGPWLKHRNATISLWVNVAQNIFKGTGVEHDPILLTHAFAGDDFNEAIFIGYHFYLRTISANNSLSKERQVYLIPVNTTYLRTWYHLVFTYDDNFASLYIDGALVSKAAKNFTSKYLENDSVLVGLRYGPKNRRYFCGTVDDIEFYDRVLSPREVLALYNAPNPNRASVVIQAILLLLLAVLLVVAAERLISARIRGALKREQEKNELTARSYQQELKVLKAQMNPHFIFNSLNSIQQFILTNENEKAQLYLSRFSRLLRNLLESNTGDSVKLSEEVDILKGYIEIESLRFNNVFRHSINLPENIKKRDPSIPNFMVQPFVENAIWHGLLPKKGDKNLSISFDMHNERTLTCTIEDNGVGRRTANGSATNGKGKSMAVELISQRMELLNKVNKTDCRLTIADRHNEKGESEGTVVRIDLPIIHN